MSIKAKDLPGPKGLPFIGSLHQVKIARLHLFFESCAQKYGDVFNVKLGPVNFTVVAKPEIIRGILKARPAHFRRMSKMDKILKSEGVHGVFNAEGEDWKVHRRIVNRGLDIKHQQQFYPSMLSIVERLHARMLAASASSVNYDLQADLSRFTVDVTTSLAFGFEMNTLEQRGGVIQEHMEKLFPMIFKRINDLVPWHKFYRSKKDREYDHAFVETGKYVKRFIASGRERLEASESLKENPADILEALLVAADEEEAITDLEIKGNLLTLLLAGEDTTTHSLAWAIFLICRHPEVQLKLQQEADEILGEDLCLKQYEKNDKLEYTTAVINETLRMKSVAPLLLLEPLEDIDIENYHFRKGAKVIVLTRAGALSPQYFSESEQFNPGRWVSNDAKKCPVHNLEAFMPFGSGPRLCPGKNLATLEMKLVLSMIAKNFTIELVTPEAEVQENLAFTMMPDKFDIRIKMRILTQA